jgi:putative ABC transport system permease protein
MRAIFVKALADVRRRRLQAAVIFVTVILAVGTGTMALMIVSQTSDPFKTAFQAQKGAHLQVFFDPQTDIGRLAATPSLIGATAFGGPYRTTDVQFQSGGHKYVVTAIGRDNPNGDVEQLRVTAGRWPSSDNEIALTRSFAEVNHISIGDHLKVVSVAEKPVLTVAAEVVDIDEAQAGITSQHAWVLGSAIAPLAAKDTSSYLMNYRFTGDPTTAQLKADLDKLSIALPPGSITSSVNYLFIHSIFNVANQAITSVLIAFSIFALAATAAIVANLVTGIVISGYREIGIMKAVGFTPLQVVGVFVVQVLIPAAAACVAGIPAGTFLSQPLLANSSQALGLAYQATFSPALDLLALAGALLIVVIAALLPALRAGLLRPAVVIANATAPRGRSGRWLRRLASGARLPRPIVLGLGEAVARPLRAILTLVAIFVGIATVVVALGETRSFAGIYNYEAHAGKVDVGITRSPALTDADAMQLISSQPETASVVSEATANITVPGIADPVLSIIFRGDSSKLGYLMVAGRWINGPGEVVAPRGLLQDAHLKIGDTLTGTFRGSAMRVRVVGEVYDFLGGPGGHELIVDWSTIASMVPDISPFTYLVTLKRGTDVAGFVTRVAAAQPDLLDVHANNSDARVAIGMIDAVLFVIAAVLALIAVAGIFNTLLLNTRERVRDTATLKALGMSPRQVIGMVATSAAVLALVGGAAAVPGGLALSRLLFDLVGNIGGDNIPSAAYGAFASWELIAIPLGGVAVAVAAALIPGRWAARTNVVEVLHAE